MTTPSKAGQKVEKLVRDMPKLVEAAWKHEESVACGALRRSRTDYACEHLGLIVIERLHQREEGGGRVTKGQVGRAVRDALHRLNEWQDVTGALAGSYEAEVESIVEDAVHIGIRAALGHRYIGVESDELVKGCMEESLIEEQR